MVILIYSTEQNTQTTRMNRKETGNGLCETISVSRRFFYQVEKMFPSTHYSNRFAAGTKVRERSLSLAVNLTTTSARSSGNMFRKEYIYETHLLLPD